MIYRKAVLLWFFVSVFMSCSPMRHWAPKSCEMTGGQPVPARLSQTCLYSDIINTHVSSQLHAFTPNYQLWSDGAVKSRWIFLPSDSKINSDDPDRWVFPVGTQIFKEFRKEVLQDDGTRKEIKVETRHLMKTHEGEGLPAWSIATYAWRDNQLDAVLSSGEINALGTGHRIPTEKQCVLCHKGNVDLILGFDALQLSDAQARHAFGHGPKRSPGQWSLQSLLDGKRLTTPIKQTTLPGTPLEQKVLGYLHANCGNCHNPMGHAADEEAEHLRLRHKLAFQSLEGTDVYHTAVNQPTQNFTIAPYIVMGAKHEEMALYKSALFLRMNSLDEDYRMPMIGREQVDYEALKLFHQWLLTLPTPEDFDFQFDVKKTPEGINNTITKPASSSPTFSPTSKGLHINVQFSDESKVPPVMIIYWPEDNSLEHQPVMDHKDGHFTRKMIVGPKGSMMSLRNSDDVGHTIYVKDKRQNIRWQLNYMPPGSRFDQALFWDNDIFVEMRCRLHLYMSAWVGSISSQYHKIIEFQKGETTKTIKMTDFPDNFSQLSIWMPKTKVIRTQIREGEDKIIKISGLGTTIKLKRNR